MSNFVLKLSISRVVSDRIKSSLNFSLRYAERDNIKISKGKIALKKQNELSPKKHDFSTKIVKSDLKLSISRVLLDKI